MLYRACRQRWRRDTARRLNSRRQRTTGSGENAAHERVQCR